MPQISRCPHCTKPLQLPDGAAGKQVRCPSCRQVFVAAPEPVAVGAAAAPAAPPPSVPPAAAPPPSVPPAAPRPTPAPPSEPAADPTLAFPSQAATPTQTGNVCPACKAPLLPGAIACMDCGFLIQAEEAGQPGAPCLCPNPACGVANPPGERYCQRCSSPLPAASGTMLHGRYRIERLLAVGGFGAVYLATDLKEGKRPVAIKDMICTDPQEFAIRLNFFRREAEILRSLDSLPVVPRVYDFIQQEQTAHLVLEYIRGQDLLKLLEARGNKPFPLDLVTAWGMSICDVLSHMHNQSPPLIHRDLKPENIMLLEDQRTIKLIDFGTARDLGRTQKDRQAAKTRVYTEGYAPPEQIVGKPEARSDLFALAGTLYHLATGTAPEGAQTAQELATRLAGDGLPAEERWFYELIRINLADDPNERYFSARDVKADLERRQVTGEVACSGCKATNPVRQPYCTQCAAPLTDPTPPCNYCGKTNRMGSRCCIHCGNRLR